MLLAAWAAGRAVRTGRAYTAGLREQAERRAEARVDQSRRAVAEERLGIARELHDVVAHSMSVVAVQAGVGRYVIDANPAEAARALAAIETTSKAALREMRQLLGMLRDGTPGEMLAALGLADIPELAGRAGVRVEVAVQGTPRDLPAGMDLAAYRIVQEALTNVVKHARTDRGRVVVSYTAEAVTVEVTDDGVGVARGPGDGHGGEPGDGPAAVADDQVLVRAGFRVLVDTAPDLRVVGEAGTGEEAVEVARRVRPDVVLMDIPKMDGIEATRRILRPGISTRIMILTTFDLDEYVFAALRAGASGFLLKDTDPGDLLAAIRVIATGEGLLAPTVTRRLIEEFARRPDPGAAPARSLDGITSREREVLGLIGAGA